MDIKIALFSFFGGLGLFLFGIKSMSEGLQSVAGDRMRIILEKGTKTPLRGVITGALVTALIQSSSGTTVLAVGLVNAGLMTLRQAIGVVMGANIGTTVTAYLIGFKLKQYALPIIAIGVFCQFFLKSKKFNSIGKAVMGFGLLFYGMDVMGTGMKPLRGSEFFLNMMLDVENNAIFGVFVGSIFTAIVQSSSATIGILQELANQGVISYTQSLPILFGDNIGTTVTALLAGIGASIAARRTALIHFLFNIIGTLIFVPLLVMGIFIPAVEFITNSLGFMVGNGENAWEMLNIKMQIAQTHGIFNISNTLIQLPFVAILAKIATKLIPGEEDDYYTPQYLEPRVLGNLPVALSNAHHEVERMGELAIKTFDYSCDFFFKRDPKLGKKAKKYEDSIDQLEVKITEYILAASTGNAFTDDVLSKKSYQMLQIIGDLERIGDHSDNIVDATEYLINYNLSISPQALEELGQMIERVRDGLKKAMIVFNTGDKKLAYEVIENDDVVDEMEKNLRKNHILRLNVGNCDGGANAIFVDILSNLERIGDHAVNIAEYTLESKKA